MSEQVETATKALTADVGATIGGFIGGPAGDAQVSRLLNDAEFYYYIAQHHPWVGAAVTLIAEAIASDGYDIIAPGVDRNQTAVDGDPRVAAMRVVFESVNERQSLLDLVEELSLDYDITGRFYALKLRLPNGRMIGAERVDPRTMAPVLTADGKRIAKFVQKCKVNGTTQTQSFKAEDVIYCARPGGADVTGGPSILDELDLTIAVDTAARRHNAAFFKNGARAGDVYINENLTKDQAEKSEATIKETNRTPERAYRPIVLSGKWTIDRANAGVNDEEYTKGQDRALTEVCGVFHIPEGKLKSNDGALGQAGKEVDDQTFHEECVAPRARRIYRALTREILVKEWRIADLAIVPKAKYQFRLSNLDAAAKMLQAGGTVSEARSVWNAPKLEAQEGADLDAPMVANTVKQYQDAPDPLEMMKAKAALAPPPGAVPGAAPTPAPAAPPKPNPAKKSTRFRSWRPIDGE